MAPCLCAPTTHEGSFRCRLHRGLPAFAFDSPAPNLASDLHKGASVRLISREICVDKPICLVRLRELPSNATVLLMHRANSYLYRTSSFESSPSPSPQSYSPSSSPSFRHGRPPPARKAGSSSAASSGRCSHPGSLSITSTALVTASSTSRSTASSSTSHAAAMAIMKHHLQKQHGRCHMNGSNTVPRSSAAGYKIGPSRLSQMGMAACTEEDSALIKSADCHKPNHLPAHNAFPAKCSFILEPQARQSTSMEASQIDLKMHSVVAKSKQSDSPCKPMGYKARPFIVPIVY